MKNTKEVQVAVEEDSAGNYEIVITCPYCKKTTRLPFLETMEKYKTSRAEIRCSCGKATFVL